MAKRSKRPIIDEFGNEYLPRSYIPMPNYMNWVPSWANVIPTAEAAERPPTTSAQLRSTAKPNPSQDFNNQAMLATILDAVPERSREAAARNIPIIMKALKDEGILTPNVLAYALATIQHETAGTFQPIEEYYGRQQAKKLGYSGGENYFGRGFIQLTHDYNYRNYGQRIGLGDQLVSNPELALNPEVAAKLLAAFLKDSGTAAIAQSGDFYNARAGVNRYDYRTYQPIADTAYSYRSNISPNIGDFDSTALSMPSLSQKGGIDYGKMIQSALAPPVEASESPQGKFTSVRPTTATQPKTQAERSLSFMPSSLAYTVQPGDTLWGTAQRYLGAGSRYGEIQGYTGASRQLPIGTQLTIPKPTTLGGYQPKASEMRPAQSSIQTVTRPTSIPGVSVSYTPTPPRTVQPQTISRAPIPSPVPTPSPIRSVTPAQRIPYIQPAPAPRASAQTQSAVARALSAPVTKTPSAQLKTPSQNTIVQSITRAITNAINSLFGKKR